MDHWNTLVKVINSEKSKDIVYAEYCSGKYTIEKMATMLLGQFNTASGSRVKPSIEKFINNINITNPEILKPC